MKSIFVLLASLFIISNAVAYAPLQIRAVLQTDEDTITATITKSTTDDQFSELIDYFEKNGIALNLSKVDYNAQNEITSIKIDISKDDQQRNFNLSTNTAIGDIELGMRKGVLFIDSGTTTFESQNSLADLFEQFSGNHMNIQDFFSNSAFNFDFDINDEDIQNFLNNDLQNFDFNELRDQFLAERDEDQKSRASSNKAMPTFNFIDQPGVNKLIIIDGKESNFKILNRLAKADELHEVDVLKSSVAVSLYGDKAADGAIIATTK